MADVFISYARSTAKQAQAAARALRSLGYSVWMDDELPAHRTFTGVIQEELDAAKAALVIWSTDAVDSEWVLSEANRAREAHKLVQASVDSSRLPMPFDQLQCVDLSGWSGNGRHPGWPRVTASIADLVKRTGAAAPTAGPPAPARSPFWRRPRAGPWVWALAAAFVLAAAASGAWLLRGRVSRAAGPSEVRVAVLPIDTLSPGPEVRYFADGLLDEIVSTLSVHQVKAVSRSESAALRGPDARQAIDRLGVRLLLGGTARGDGEALHVRVHLDDAQARETLWSRQFDGSSKDPAILQERVAHRIVAVLACSREALQPVRGVSDPALVKRYLQACDVFADWDVHTGYNPQANTVFVETLKALTAEAPGFPGAHADLAVNDAISAIGAPAEQAASLRAESAAHASRALALDPKSADAYGARSMLLSHTRWAERERLLRQGVAANPRRATTNYWLGSFLAETGRLREATGYAQKSAANDMVFDWGLFSAYVTCGTGQPDQALSDIAHFRRLMPDSLVARDIQVLCLTYSGRWDAARDVSAEGAGKPGDDPKFRASLDAFILAAKSRAPADRERARRLALEGADGGARALTTSVAWLASFGFVDDAFALSDRYNPDAAIADPFPGVFLFSPLTAPMRRDPRFMALAARLGLVDYWRSSGHWPDFCAEPALPYDCRVEAARLPHA